MKTNLQPDESPRPSGPRFGLRMIFLVTLMVAVTAATWGGLMREGPDRMKFLLFGAAAPFGVLVLVGLLHQLFGKHRR